MKIEFFQKFQRTLFSFMELIFNGIRKTRVRNRLIVSFIVLSIFPLITLGILSYVISSNSIEKKVNMYSVQLINQISKNISIDLKKFEDLNKEIIFDKQNQKLFDSITKQTDKIENLQLLKNVQSVLVSKYGAFTKNIIHTEINFGVQARASSWSSSNVTPEELTKITGLTPENGTSLWTNIKIDSSGKAENLLLCQRVFSLDENKPIGYSFTIFSKQYLADLISNISIGEGSNIFIFNRNMEKIIDSTDTSDAMSSEQTEIGNIILNTEKTSINTDKTTTNKVFNFTSKNTNSMIAYTPIQSTDWIIAFNIPYKFLNAESNLIKYIIIGFLTICSVFALIITFLVSLSIAVPLSDIVLTMKAVESGNLNVSINNTSNDEVGQLSTSFNNMIEKLRAVDKIKDEVLASTYLELLERNKNIMDSIIYAKTIQNAILPREDLIIQSIQEHFILWQPRDIVSGDIYWFEQVGEAYLIGVIDCTGHGIPGAFMTMTANSVLERITSEFCNDNPAKILKELNKLIRQTFNQNSNEPKDSHSSDDGMDIGLCYINPKNQKLIYAGAKIPLYICKDDELIIINADKQGIGYRHAKEDFEYSNHTVELSGDMVFYLSTDGFVDQRGSESGFGFGRKNFTEILLKIHKDDMSNQKNTLVQILEAHKGTEEQIDDITVIGFKA